MLLQRRIAVTIIESDFVGIGAAKPPSRITRSIWPIRIEFDENTVNLQYYTVVPPIKRDNIVTIGADFQHGMESVP